METQLLVKAIHKLKPNSEFVFYNDDYKTIEWLALEGKAPTLTEINSAIESIKADELSAANEQAAQKAALLTKLNITADEAKLLFA